MSLGISPGLAAGGAGQRAAFVLIRIVLRSVSVTSGPGE